MRLECLNFSDNNSSPAKFNITDQCALFDFMVYTVLVGTLCVLGLIGNVVAFTVLCRDRSKAATSFILRALAVADSLVLLSALPLYAAPPVYPFTGWLQTYYEMYMDIMPFLWPTYLIPYTGTIFLTVLVTVNRYIAVCKPFKSGKLCSPVQSKRHVIIIAIFAVLYNIPRFFEYEKIEVCVAFNKSKEGFEVSAFGNNRFYRIIYANVLYFVVMHGGPLLSLSLLNVKLIKALKLRQQRRADMGKGGYQQDITLVLIVVVFVFIFCQTPTFIDHIFWTVLDQAERTCGHWHYYYTAVGDLLAVTNSAANFVIYILTSRKFRESLLTSCSQQPQQQFLRLNSATRAEMTVLTQTATQGTVNNNHPQDLNRT